MSEHLLENTKMGAFHAVAYEGKAAFKNYIQLIGFVQYVGGCTSLFALPKFNGNASEIDWYTSLEGERRKADALPPLERDVVVAKFRQCHAYLEEQVEKYIAQDDTRAIASLLKSALQFPGEKENLWAVGNEPVLVCWGFRKTELASVEEGERDSLTPPNIDSVTRHPQPVYAPSTETHGGKASRPKNGKNDIQKGIPQPWTGNGVAADNSSKQAAEGAGIASEPIMPAAPGQKEPSAGAVPGSGSDATWNAASSVDAGPEPAVVPKKQGMPDSLSRDGKTGPAMVPDGRTVANVSPEGRSTGYSYGDRGADSERGRAGWLKPLLWLVIICLLLFIAWELWQNGILKEYYARYFPDHAEQPIERGEAVRDGSLQGGSVPAAPVDQYHGEVIHERTASVVPVPDSGGIQYKTEGGSVYSERSSIQERVDSNGNGGQGLKSDLIEQHSETGASSLEHSESYDSSVHHDGTAARSSVSGENGMEQRRDESSSVVSEQNHGTAPGAVPASAGQMRQDASAQLRWLEVPSAAGGLPALEGRWICVMDASKVMNTTDPVQLQFTFGADGRGRAFVIRGDAVTDRGDVAATLDGNTLGITTGPIGRYPGLKLDCANSGEGALCSGTSGSSQVEGIRFLEIR